MSAITPEILYKLEDNMQVISENEMARIVLEENLWWKKLARVRTSVNRKETLAWLLSTARIESQGEGGNVRFDDMSSAFAQYEHERFGAGLRLDVDQLSDNDSHGFDIASEWAAQVGNLSIYFPQERMAQLIIDGEKAQSLAYDGKPYFSPPATAHPVNPFKTSAGSYANLFTGGASGVYPGALPIDEVNCATVDQARANIQKALAYIASIRMPNGKTPRRLKVVGIAGPPTLAARIQEVTKAKFIAQAAPGGGGGSGDIEAVIRNWAFGEPIDMPELLTMGNGTTDLTSWYIITQQVTTTQLGALVWIDRDQFRVTYYTGAGGGNGVDAILDRANELEWHLKGRNADGYGHPYGLFKCKAA